MSWDRPVRLRRAHRMLDAISEWDVTCRETGRVLGTVARDDIAWGERHLWHAWLADYDEAIGNRYLTRADAVADLLAEWNEETP